MRSRLHTTGFISLIFTLIVFALILVVMKLTRIGLEHPCRFDRTGTWPKQWASAPNGSIHDVRFGLGYCRVRASALSQLTNVGAESGQSYIIDSFMVVVSGGVGNLWGSL